MAQESALFTGLGDFYRKVLNRNIGTLIEDLDPQPVLDTLLAEEIIPYTQVRDIQELRFTSEKNRKIVEFVITRGRDGYLNFKKCLIKSGQKHIADSLERAETELKMEAQMEKPLRASGIKITPRVPTNDDLMDIAQHIGNNWEFIGTQLNISQPRIDQIKLDNPTTHMRIYKLLLLWRNSQPNSNTFDKLLAVLRELKLKGSVTLDWERILDIANRKPEKSNTNIQRESPITRTPVERLRLTTNDGNMTSDQRADFQTDEDYSLNSTAFKYQFGQTCMQDPNRTNIYQPDISGSFRSPPRRVDEENLNVMDGPPARPGKHDIMDAGREVTDTLQRPTPALVTYNDDSINIKFRSGLNLSKHNRQLNPSQTTETSAPQPPAKSSVSPVEPEWNEDKTKDAGNLDASAFHFSPQLLKSELSMSPHDGRLRTPSAGCFKYVIGNKARRLGQGGYGIVYLLDDAIHDIGIPVVVKVIETKTENDNNKNSIANEKLASRIMDFSIVPLLAMTVDIHSGKSFFLSPYLENGDLEAKIKEDTEMIKNRKPNEVALTDIRRLVILYHVSSALDFLHRPMPGLRGGIIHMDLTTKNIVLDKMWNARLTDFGLSREFKEGCEKTRNTNSKKFGTPGYMQNPDRKHLTAADDYYNFGIVIREILTGLPPTGIKPNLQDMPPFVLERKIQKEIWGNDSHTKKLVNLSVKCNSKEENLAVKQDLLTLLEDRPRWTPNPENNRCEKCMVNTAATKESKQFLRHDLNCTNKINVCSACMRNSYLNPIICHTCTKELVPFIGAGWGALLIAGNDDRKEIAHGFKEDISRVKRVIISRCPLVMGLSESNVEVISPKEPGEEESMMTKLELAVKNLMTKDVHTLLIYFSGHYSDGGFLLGKKREFLTISKLREVVKTISNNRSSGQENKPPPLFSEKRFIVILDCCEAPNLPDQFSRLETTESGEVTAQSNHEPQGDTSKEGKIPGINYCILQINASRQSETTTGGENGSAFTDLFIKCLTQRALDIPCKMDCKHSQLTEDFIRFEDLHRYISDHGEELQICQPEKHEKSTLSADSIIAYNVNFKVVLEFKIIKVTGEKVVENEKIEVPPICFKDLQELQQTLLEKIVDGNKKDFLFEGSAGLIFKFADCTCFERENGPTMRIELDTLDRLMDAWNSKREISISMRTASNIDKGRVLDYIDIKEAKNIKELFKDYKINSETEMYVVSLKQAQMIKFEEESYFEKQFEDILTCTNNEELFEVQEETTLHILFPESSEQDNAGTPVCLEVQGLKRKT